MIFGGVEYYIILQLLTSLDPKGFPPYALRMSIVKLLAIFRQIWTPKLWISWLRPCGSLFELKYPEKLVIRSLEEIEIISDVKECVKVYFPNSHKTLR